MTSQFSRRWLAPTGFQMPRSMAVVFSFVYLGVRRILELVVSLRKGDIDKDLRSWSCAIRFEFSSASSTVGFAIGQPTVLFWLRSVASSTGAGGGHSSSHPTR
jgi:hypothetical protein